MCYNLHYSTDDTWSILIHMPNIIISNIHHTDTACGCQIIQKVFFLENVWNVPSIFTLMIIETCFFLFDGFYQESYIIALYYSVLGFTIGCIQGALCIRRTRADADGRGRTRTFNFYLKEHFFFFFGHTYIYGPNWSETQGQTAWVTPPPPISKLYELYAHIPGWISTRTGNLQFDYIL